MDIAWDITSKCNLSCIHCYNSRQYPGNGATAASGDLSIEQVRDILIQAKEMRADMIQFLGGEPFVRKDFIRILEIAIDNGIHCNVATNGTLLDGSRLAALAELTTGQVAFSIDGATDRSNDLLRGKGSFDRALHNLAQTARLFRERGTTTRLGIQCTLNRSNIGEIEAVIELGKRLGLDFVGFDSIKVVAPHLPYNRALLDLILDAETVLAVANTVASHMAAEKDIGITILNFGSPRLRQHLNDKYGIDLQVQRRCDAASEMIYIRADGSAFPCNPCSDFPADMLPGWIPRSELSAARLPLADILDSEYFKGFYRFAHSGETFACLDYCRECSLYDVCEPCPLDVVRLGDRVCKECIRFDNQIGDDRPKESVPG